MLNKTVVASLLTIMLSACSDVETIELPIQTVEVYELPETINNVERDFNGIVRAHDLVNLSFRVDGEIKSIAVNKGQKVNKGDLLAVLDTRDYQIVVDDRQARLTLTDQQVKRAKTLLDKELLSQTEYDKMQAEYLVALAEFKKAQLMLEYTELKAPFDGVIGDVFTDPFVNTKPGLEVLSLHKIDFVEIDVQLPDIILSVAKLGRDRISKLDVEVNYEAFPGQSFTAKPYELNLEKSPSSRSYIATFLVPVESRYAVLEGMPATVSIDLSDLTHTHNREFLVPVASVVMPDDSPISQQLATVWRYKDDQTVEKQEVVLGTLSGDMVEIKQGLNDGDVIVSLGANRLIDGQVVAIKKGNQ
ncbi:efflux RND transporter periplasmic adaptor subunit [Alginatibacterium sediminis]|uniref:Efflux RND transporter periplasmic adaptor subunit n=1 Tax=Alginatibacterium sediminis TaxID=2164068 RepID=A0A420EHW5_9ALTE|nr:efflux RND transporter periplasmic adaptor subunit [Alginatibacterium sediminis]RKF20250.1 efflux RND transporter periplasmic adaptor subunit [Alginatibacterium sediminis]